jgi:two-component system LytT family response regulator
MSENILIRCLVADDEPPARDIIKRYIGEMPMLELVGECSNAIQVIGFLQNHDVDLIFLDIRMPQLTGVDLLRTLRHPPKIIFTTAFAEYALEGYDLDVVDYLLKPIPFDRFIKAVAKVLQLGQQRGIVEPQPIVTQTKSDGFVYFRADRKMIKVFLSDIIYVESMKDYVKVMTAGETIITKQSITAVEAMLPASLFMRTHRSYIVSLQKIKSFTNELISVETTELPVGKLYRNGVMKMLAG